MPGLSDKIKKSLKKKQGTLKKMPYDPRKGKPKLGPGKPYKPKKGSNIMTPLKSKNKKKNK